MAIFDNEMKNRIQCKKCSNYLMVKNNLLLIHENSEGLKEDIIKVQYRCSCCGTLAKEIDN